METLNVVLLKVLITILKIGKENTRINGDKQKFGKNLKKMRKISNTYYFSKLLLLFIVVDFQDEIVSLSCPMLVSNCYEHKTINTYLTKSLI